MSFFSRNSKSAGSSMTGSAKGKEAPPPTSKIFTTPPAGIKPTKKWNYDQAQLQQIEELKQYSATLLLPESDPYYPWEARFLADPGCHARYMRASKWKMPDAKNRIKGTIEWRREYKPELIQPGDVSVEAETGKIILSGFDEDARPILYLRPGRENTEVSPRQIRHMIFHLERAIDLMPPGQEQVTIIVDYKSATSQSNPSISTGRKVLNVLQNHYVERLGRGLVVNTSWWISAFFSGISPLLDPITREKIRFNPNLTELVPAEQLDWEFGGQYNLEFDHAEYWRTIKEFCHLAEDGSRVDANGKSFIPPLGNGIQAAFEDRSSNETGTESTRNAASDATPAQRLADEHRTDEDDTELVRGMEKTNIGETGDVGGPGATTLEGEGEREVPAAVTKPGEPVGDVVFDHPPTKSEIKEALSE